MVELVLGVLVSVGICFAMIGIWLIVCFKSLQDREKLSGYECGFDPMGSSRSPFSLRFFLLAVVFLVFDVEFILLFPYISSVSSSWGIWSSIFSLLLLFVLGWGLFHEWMEGTMDWKD